MGTKADFYVGPTAEGWLGSIAYDGRPKDKEKRAGVPRALLAAKSEKSFRRAVAKLLATCEYATKPKQGWPWPWEDSSTSDCGYAFFKGRVWMAQSKVCGERGKLWSNPLTRKLTRMPVQWPDMSAKMKVASLGSTRSGVAAFRLM